MIPPNKHSTLLALDTSGPACSVALLASGNTLQAYELEAQKHTREILPLVDKLLQKGGIEKSAIQGIIISAGPGAFTGLRVGAAVAMGLAAAWNVPLLPVSSLALLAATVQRHSGANKILAVFYLVHATLQMVLRVLFYLIRWLCIAAALAWIVYRLLF